MSYILRYIWHCINVYIYSNFLILKYLALRYRSIFSKYKTFNEIQSNVFDDVFYTNKSVIVSAPTGSGKTVVFELAITNLIQLAESDVTDFKDKNEFKIVYVAPTKALCSERFIDWCKKFGPFGLQCLEVTGDSEINDFSDLSLAKIIITTPEKWDSLTRKWKDNKDIVRSVKLFMIDEVHLLNEDVRGPILEAIVSRMQTIQFNMKSYENFEMKLRFVAASATIPNIEDLAEWIGKKDPEKICYFQFSEEKRPVKLQKHVIGYDTSLASFKFDMSLNYKLPQIIRKFSGGRPTLIFCSSRKSVEMASNVLQKESCILLLSDNHKTALCDLAKRIKDVKLKPLILKGIAYHHAGLTSEDRYIIEDGFRSGILLILVSTNTLSMGVNLPAHLVIIKSTEYFVNGQAIQYSESAILQMIGRAGRPQYDLNGVAVIMTQQKNVHRYKNLVNGCTPIESHLHKHLAEHLNSEIVLQTITDLDVAMEWIRSTFLYVRACKSPINYGFKAPGMTKEKIEKKLEEMCLIQINCLETNNLIVKDQTFGLAIKATAYGKLMARYYISFDTMKLFHQIRGNESFLEIFNIIVRSKEFSDFTLRVNDKKTLNELNNKPIRFPIKGKIKTNQNKVSCLIQANFGNIPICDPSMIQDSLKMIRIGERISKCFYEYIRLSKTQSKNLNGIYKILLHSITILKCFKARLWENSEYVSKQLNKIGTVYSKALVDAGKISFKDILNTSTQSLEMILNKPPPFGTEIHDAISVFPDYQIETDFEKATNTLKILVSQLNTNFLYDGSICYLIIGDSKNNLILFFDRIASLIQEEYQFRRNISLSEKDVEWISVHLIHESLVGVDRSTKVIINENEKNEEDKSKTNERTSKRKIQTKLKPSKKKRFETENNSSRTITNDCVIELLEDEDIFNDLSTQKIFETTSIKSGRVSSPDLFEKHIETIDCSYVKETRNISELAHKYEFREKPKIFSSINKKNESQNKLERKDWDSGITENMIDLSEIFVEDFHQIEESHHNLDTHNDSNLSLERHDFPFDEYTNLSNDIIWSKIEEAEIEDVNPLTSNNCRKTVEHVQSKESVEMKKVCQKNLKVEYSKPKAETQRKYLKRSESYVSELSYEENCSQLNKNSLNKNPITQDFEIEPSYSNTQMPLDFSKKNRLESQLQNDKYTNNKNINNGNINSNEALDLSRKYDEKVNQTSNPCNITNYINLEGAQDLSVTKLGQPQFSHSSLTRDINFCSRKEKLKYADPFFNCSTIEEIEPYIPSGIFSSSKSVREDGLAGFHENLVKLKTDKFSGFSSGYDKVNQTGKNQGILSYNQHFDTYVESNTHPIKKNGTERPISKNRKNNFLHLPTNILYCSQNSEENNGTKNYNSERFPKMNQCGNFSKNLVKKNSNYPENFNSEYWSFYQTNFKDTFANSNIRNEKLSYNYHYSNNISRNIRFPEKNVKLPGLPKPKLNGQSYNIAKPKNIFGTKEEISNINMKPDFVTASDLLKAQNGKKEVLMNWNAQNVRVSGKRKNHEILLQNNFVSNKNIFNHLDSNFNLINKSKIFKNYKKNTFDEAKTENENVLETTPKEQIVLWTDFKNNSNERKTTSQTLNASYSYNNKIETSLNLEEIFKERHKIKKKNEEFREVFSSSPMAHGNNILENEKFCEKVEDAKKELRASQNLNNANKSISNSVVSHNENENSKEDKIFQNSYAHYIEKYTKNYSNIELLKTLVEGELNLDNLTLTEVSAIMSPVQPEQFKLDKPDVSKMFLNDDVPQIHESESLDTEQIQPSQHLIREQNVISRFKNINSNIDFANNCNENKENNIFQEYFPNYNFEKRPLLSDEQFGNMKRIRRSNPYRLQIYPKSECFPIRRPIPNEFTENSLYNIGEFDTIENRTFYINKLRERLNYDPNYSEQEYNNDYMLCITSDQIPQNIKNYFNNILMPQNSDNNGIFCNSFGNWHVVENNLDEDKIENDISYKNNRNIINPPSDFQNEFDKFEFPKIKFDFESTEPSNSFQNQYNYYLNENSTNICQEEFIEPKIEVDSDSEKQKTYFKVKSPNTCQRNEFVKEQNLEFEFNSEESDVIANNMKSLNFTKMQSCSDDSIKQEIINDFNGSIEFTQNFFF